MKLPVDRHTSCDDRCKRAKSFFWAVTVVSDDIRSTGFELCRTVVPTLAIPKSLLSSWEVRTSGRWPGWQPLAEEKLQTLLLRCRLRGVGQFESEAVASFLYCAYSCSPLHNGASGSPKLGPLGRLAGRPGGQAWFSALLFSFGLALVCFCWLVWFRPIFSVGVGAEGGKLIL